MLGLFKFAILIDLDENYGASADFLTPLHVLLLIIIAADCKHYRVIVAVNRINSVAALNRLLQSNLLARNFFILVVDVQQLDFNCRWCTRRWLCRS